MLLQSDVFDGADDTFCVVLSGTYEYSPLNGDCKTVLNSFTEEFAFTLLPDARDRFAADALDKSLHVLFEPLELPLLFKFSAVI